MAWLTQRNPLGNEQRGNMKFCLYCENQTRLVSEYGVYCEKCLVAWSWKGDMRTRAKGATGTRDWRVVPSGCLVVKDSEAI